MKCDPAHMDPSKLLKFFKTRKRMAAVAMVSRQAVAVWFKTGIVPRRSSELLRRAMQAKRRA